MPNPAAPPLFKLRIVGSACCAETYLSRKAISGLASAAHSLREISKERSVEVSLTRGKFFNATLPSLTLISRPTSTLHFFGIGGGGDRRR